MDKDVKFKKVGFGGYDKDEVDAYISHVIDSFGKYKAESEKNAAELKNKLKETEKLCDELKKENADLKANSACVESGSISVSEAEAVVKELSDGIEKLRRIIEGCCLGEKTDDTAKPNDNALCKDEELDDLISKYL